jgi:hypothetical protein
MITNAPIDLGKASKETKILTVGPSDNFLMTAGDRP